MARDMLTPDAARGRPGSSIPSSSRLCSTAKPHQRLRWHYFLLWQMIGFEMWHEMFIDPLRPDRCRSAACRRRSVTR